MSHGAYIHIRIESNQDYTIEITFETKQKNITLSYHSTHRHDHTNTWYVYVSLKKLISITDLECSYNTTYVYNDKLSI